MVCSITVPKNDIERFCRENHILKLSVFGSVLREDFRPDSDVDVLVEFDSDHIPDFFSFLEMEDDLSALLGGRKIDLVTSKFLNHRIRRHVLKKRRHCMSKMI